MKNSTVATICAIACAFLGPIGCDRRTESEKKDSLERVVQNAKESTQRLKTQFQAPDIDQESSKIIEEQKHILEEPAHSAIPPLQKYASYWVDVIKRTKTLSKVTHEDTGAPIALKMQLAESPVQWSKAIGSRRNDISGTDPASMQIDLAGLVLSLHWKPTDEAFYEMQKGLSGSNDLLEWFIDDWTDEEKHLTHRLISFRLKLDPDVYELPSGYETTQILRNMEGRESQFKLADWSISRTSMTSSSMTVDADATLSQEASNKVWEAWCEPSQSVFSDKHPRIKEAIDACIKSAAITKKTSQEKFDYEGFNFIVNAAIGPSEDMTFIRIIFQDSDHTPEKIIKQDNN